MSLANPKPTGASPAPEFGRRALSPDRWVLLERWMLEQEPVPQNSNGKLICVIEPVEIEGITFLPAVYYPA